MTNITFNVKVPDGADEDTRGKLNNALYRLGYRLLDKGIPFDDSYVRTSDDPNVMPLVFLGYEGHLGNLGDEVEKVAKRYNTEIVNFEC